MELDKRNQPPNQGENPEAQVQEDPIMESLSDTKEKLSECLVELHRVERTTETTLMALGIIPDPETAYDMHPPDCLMDVWTAVERAEEALQCLNRAIELLNLRPDSSQDTPST